MTRASGAVLAAVLLLGGCNGKAGNTQQPNPSAQDSAETYIPRDLNDCFAELKRLLNAEDILTIKNDADGAMSKYHSGLGLHLRNKWGSWKGSRLAKWFNSIGIYHPDDMSGIILSSFWRHLNDKPIGLAEQVKHYQDYWRKIDEESSTIRPTTVEMTDQPS